VPEAAVTAVVSSYDRHAGRPRHIVALKPSGIDPDAMPARQAVTLASPPRRAGLLIGGDSGLFHYEEAEWRQLLDFLDASHAAHGTRWIVSTSRRTSAHVADKAVALARRSGSPIEKLIDYRSAGPGTLPRLFQEVDAILATADSSTMVSEAIAARLPVVGVTPGQSSFKDDEREYRAFMERQGWSRFLPLVGLTPERFLAELAAVRPLAVNPLDRLATELAALGIG
ncbi:MAG TPA: ELM1/GtrOC1 family putative glycosyltransferase, partial [Hyphomicrobiaceae bacterium]|nr:ELM1/GtrOC1 family putative glycosyltransferase [Hyphomicrobiaceae bacterium]